VQGRKVRGEVLQLQEPSENFGVENNLLWENILCMIGCLLLPIPARQENICRHCPTEVPTLLREELQPPLTFKGKLHLFLYLFVVVILLLFYCCVGWGYIVTFIKLLTIY
jgi:hypothetical protein